MDPVITSANSAPVNGRTNILSERFVPVDVNTGTLLGDGVLTQGTTIFLERQYSFQTFYHPYTCKDKFNALAVDPDEVMEMYLICK